MARNYALTWAPSSTFPLSVAPSGRYLQTASGSPFFVHGEAAWSAIANLTDSDQLTYLNNAQARGINAIMVNLFEHHFSSNAPNDKLGNAPFTGTAFQTSLGSAYMTRAVAFIRAAAARGICVFLNPEYAGFGGGSEGWHTEITAATQAQRIARGAEIAGYLAVEPNIVWCAYGDYDPPSHQPYIDIFTGITNGGDTHIRGGHHYTTNENSHDNAEAYAWDFIYRYGGVVSSDVDAGWAAAAKPVLLGEAWYELENGATSLDVRRQAYGAFCAGACGHFFSHRDLWGYGNGLFQTGTWQDAINNVGGVAPAREQMPYLQALVAGLSGGFQLGSPDRTGTLITSGRGTAGTSSYITARYCSTWAVIYVPAGSASTFTVARSGFAGSLTPLWRNPRTNATQSAGGSVANTGSQSFTPPDANDWILQITVP